MILYNRDSIANDINFKVFNGKTVWALIFERPRAGIRFVSAATSCYNKDMFEKLHSNVKRRVESCGGRLDSVYIVKNNRKKFIDYKNADDLMKDIMRNEIPLFFKVMVKNKYYEYKVEH